MARHAFIDMCSFQLLIEFRIRQDVHTVIPELVGCVDGCVVMMLIHSEEGVRCRTTAAPRAPLQNGQ